MSAGLSGRTGRPAWMGVGGGPGRDGFRDRGLVLVKAAEGWWFQIARRFIWVTSDTTDEGRLLELLLDGATTSDEVVPLVATEPILIAAPMTQQPVEWAFTARIWTDEVQRPNDRPWGHPGGDDTRPRRTDHHRGRRLDPQEIACQVVPKGYWHGYISAHEPALARAVATAYPKSVQRIQRHTRAPTREVGSCDAACPPWIRPSARRRANPSIRSQTARRPYPSCTSPPRETRPNQPPTSHLTRASPLGPLHEEPTPTAPADTTKTLPYRPEASRHARTGRETPKGRRRNVNQRNA